MAGVITDIDGNFSLNVQNDAKQIKISYIGYVDQVVNLNGRSDFKIVLKEDNNALDEVVVVGYGSQKKATLTGAVEQDKQQNIREPCHNKCRSSVTGCYSGIGCDSFFFTSGQ